MGVRDGLVAARPASPTQLGNVPQTGVYAWWDLKGALSAVYPPGFPAVDVSRPLYVGLAAKRGLDVRGLSMHLKTTRMSSLRRSLSALLVTELNLQSCVRVSSGGKFGLVEPAESRVTEWMLEHLLVTWVVHDAPGSVEGDVINDLLPPLNDRHAHRGDYWAPMAAARAGLRINASI